MHLTQLGYTLSSEENDPTALVAPAARAEAVDFTFASISDHFHPWIDRQGQSPFVWGVLGAIAERTERLQLITGVTCPTFRIHPAIVAHAAATAATLLPGRFSLGLGSGENLNEHILGEHWPPVAERQERLEEAIELIRLLWEGKLCSHRGRHYTVENARLYTLPATPPPILVAVAGMKSAELAGRCGDGLVGTAPVAETLERFRSNAGADSPAYGQLDVCWAESEEEARRTALEYWPNAAFVICGPDPQRHLNAIAEYAEAGYSHVYLHQIGPDQEGFFDFYAREILPRFN